jgi:hypothetical protein
MATPAADPWIGRDDMWCTILWCKIVVVGTGRGTRRFPPRPRADEELSGSSPVAKYKSKIMLLAQREKRGSIETQSSCSLLCGQRSATSFQVEIDILRIIGNPKKLQLWYSLEIRSVSHRIRTSRTELSKKYQASTQREIQFKIQVIQIYSL